MTALEAAVAVQRLYRAGWIDWDEPVLWRVAAALAWPVLPTEEPTA